MKPTEAPAPRFITAFVRSLTLLNLHTFISMERGGEFKRDMKGQAKGLLSRRGLNNRKECKVKRRVRLSPSPLPYAIRFETDLFIPSIPMNSEISAQGYEGIIEWVGAMERTD